MGTFAITIFPDQGPSAPYRHAELHQFTRCIQVQRVGASGPRLLLRARVDHRPADAPASPPGRCGPVRPGAAAPTQRHRGEPCCSTTTAPKAAPPHDASSPEMTPTQSTLADLFHIHQSSSRYRG